MISKNIQGKIIFVCNHISNKYVTKKHGGYKIYEDDKVIVSTDDYVPNVDLSVKTTSGLERVFGCSYTGGEVTYHSGKWEEYLDSLYKKAFEVHKEKEAIKNIQLEKEKMLAESCASDLANEVFN